MRLEALSDQHDCSGFACGKQELDDWLRSAAPTAHRMGTSRVFVWLRDEDDVVAGYFALAPHTVDRGDVPSPIAHGAPKQIPAILLGKLALDRSLRHQGLGRVLLAVALSHAINGMRQVGGRVIVVDAIDEDAHAFYERYGFHRVPDDPHRLLRKASDVAKSLGLPWP